MPGAQEFLDSIVAKYLAAGVVSYCPPEYKPLFVSPLNVVPKKTYPFFRMVINLRGANEFMQD